MASLVLEDDTREDFQTIFDVYHSDDTCEESSFTRLMLSYLENYDDPKTMAAFQTVGTKYKDCFGEALVKVKRARIRKISEVKEKYKGKRFPPFICAARNGNVEDVRILISEEGMDVNQKEYEYGGSAFNWTATNGHTELCNIILQHPSLNINQQNNRGNSPLHNASYYGFTEIVKLLLNQSNIQVNITGNSGFTPLHFASLEGHTEVVELLLNRTDIQVNIKTNHGDTPLHAASIEGHTETVKLLLNQDCQVNLKDKDGHTPLYMASKNGKTEIVNLLKANGGRGAGSCSVM